MVANRHDARLVRVWLANEDIDPETAAAVVGNLQALRKSALMGVTKRAGDGDPDAIRWLEEHKYLKFRPMVIHEPD